MPSRLHVTSSSAMGFAGAFFGAMGSNPAIQYVAPNGNDAASGADWTNAKQTILAAYDALPAGGGTIYFADLSTIGGSVANQGLWILGTLDPNYASPPAGWRTPKHLRLIGIGNQNMSSSPVPGARLLGGSSTDASMPGLWITGCSVPMLFENVIITNPNYQLAPAVAIRLGVTSDQTSRSVITTSLCFWGCGAESSFAGGGPTVDIGGYLFEVWFQKCAFRNYSAVGANTDAGACVLVNPSTNGNATYLLYLEDIVMTTGGLRYYGGAGSGTSKWGLSARHIIVESLNNASAAAIEFVSVNTYGQAYLEDIQVYDSTTGVVAVKVDSAIDPSQVLVVGTGGVGGPAAAVYGPATIIQQAQPGGQVETLPNVGNAETGYISPFPNQIGFWTQGRIVAQHDSARRAFGLVAARFVNRANQDPMTWTLGVGVSATFSQPAPDGTNNAVLLTSTNSSSTTPPGYVYASVAVGDWIIAGVWAKVVSGGGTTGQLNVSGSNGSLRLNNGSSSQVNVGPANAPTTATGQWEWMSLAAKVTTQGAASQTFRVGMQTGNAGNQVAFYAPVLLYLPVGTVTDDEAKYISMHLSSWSDSAVVGHISPLKTQVINAIGGLATRIKAGAPVDADYATPVDGLIVTDTTNNKIWTRIGGVWKGTIVS